MKRTRLAMLYEYFEELPDPRVDRRRRHELLDIVVLTICAILGGCNEFTAIETFGNSKLEWLRTFLKLPNGIPSHDTIGRVMSLLDAEAFGKCFGRWMAEACADLPIKQVAIDGKSMRGSGSKGSGCVHLVSAFATENGVTLGQRAVAEKSNEITAIPELLKTLDVAGAVVTIDAMGCQKDIAQAIRDREADYLLAVKGNQETLHRDIETFTNNALENDYAGIDYSYYEESAKGHGRDGFRGCYVFNDVSFISEPAKWVDLKCVVMIVSERIVNGKSISERRYYIASRAGDATMYAGIVLGHWGIENNLHWMLDVQFDDDLSRVRAGNAAANFAWLKKTALAMLKAMPDKLSINLKRHKAGWENDYLEDVIRNFLGI